MNSKKFIFISLALLIIICFISLFIGASKISFMDTIDGIFNIDSVNGRIIYYARLPRIITTVICGMALSLSGFMIQSVLRNPLAGPNIIGVNSGALFMIVLVSCIFPSCIGFYAIVPAFIGAFIACAVIYLISRKAGLSKTTLVLAGIAVNSILQALVDFIIEINPDSLPYSQIFKVGGATSVTLGSVWPFIIIIIAGIIIALFMAKKLDIFALGDEVSHSLGLNYQLVRFLALAVSCMLAASAVSMMGLVGFVGLIVPHIVRIFCPKTKDSMLGCIFFGGFFLTICDTLARTIFSPFEIPVGIILSFIGGPFFLYLLIRRKSYDKV